VRLPFAISRTRRLRRRGCMNDGVVALLIQETREDYVRKTQCQ
jgi:hypothetical protein